MKRVLSALIVVLAVQVSWGSALGLPAGRTTTTTNTNFPGIIDNKPMRFHVFGADVLPVEPTTSPNVIGGFSGSGAASAGLTAAVARLYYASIGIPEYCIASGWRATVGGGYWNRADGDYATVGGGRRNYAGGHVYAGKEEPMVYYYGDYATVGGGYGNDAIGDYATVGGGHDNDAGGNCATVGGGFSNNAIGKSATVGGGYRNYAGDAYATVGGGHDNDATGNCATVGGGYRNYAGDYDYATVGGGFSNDASGKSATVGGGYRNDASGNSATVGGGDGNEARDDWATVGGGFYNDAIGKSATVGGGRGNDASHYATVGGGDYNDASGDYSTVPGGTGNSAIGDYSFAAGRNAKANHLGAFVWADGSTGAIASTGINQFIVRASGGIWLGDETESPDFSDGFINTSTGGYLDTNGHWVNGSDRARKGNFVPVDGRDILARLATVPISTWDYKAEDSSIRHMGPVGQDFYAAFGLGADDRHISTVDADGVALAAIQGLYELVRDKDAQIADLKARVEALEALVSSSAQGQ